MPRYDLLLAPADAGFALSEAALRAFVREVAIRRWATPVAEAVAREWVVLDLEPGPDAHRLFDEGEAPAEAAFERAMLHVSNAPTDRPFGLGPPTRFALTLYGARAEHLHGATLQRLRDALNLRLEVTARPAGDRPALPEVPPDQVRPPAATRTPPLSGPIGTRVEEF